jgi:hypothetical protein
MTVYIFGLMLLSSCKQVDNKKIIVPQADSVKSAIKTDLSNEIKIDSLFKLDFIMPIKIFGTGGGGYYTYDTTDVVPEKLVFSSTLNGDSAVIKINGKEIYLFPDSLNFINRHDGFLQDAWKGHGLSVILKVNVINETGDEIKCKGTMEIKNSKSIIKFNVHGGWED